MMQLNECRTRFREQNQSWRNQWLRKKFAKRRKRKSFGKKLPKDARAVPVQKQKRSWSKTMAVKKKTRKTAAKKKTVRKKTVKCKTCKSCCKKMKKSACGEMGTGGR